MPPSSHPQAPSGEKKAGGVLGWVFGTPHGCMLTFLGCSFPLAIASPWIIYYGAAYYEAIRNEMTPPAQREFELIVMEPIPKGVTNIQKFGALDSMTSVVVLTFDEDPATFPVLLERCALTPVRKEDQVDCDILNFSAAPEMEGADYFERYPTDGTSKVITIKANPSRTKVQYAYRGIDVLHP